jgi:N-acetylglucosaminyldiphosphoundecaprenol N-acetyl-beta-D-mannosaminyltransferase
MQSNSIPKLNVAGANISTTSYDEVTSTIAGWFQADPLQQSPSRYICVTSVHGIITARSDRELHDSINNADIATPDGMPVVWALRSFGATDQRRVYGPTLMLHLCQAAASLNAGVYLYGGRPEVLPALCERLRQITPGLSIVGSYSPPFRPLSPAEDDHVIRMIRDSGARLVFIGISTPRQEKWMAAHQQHLPGTVMVGVGAAFDFHAGRVRQAPLWVQNAGFEWLFRLMMEPRRLWRRYLLTTPMFLPLWGWQKAHAWTTHRKPVFTDRKCGRTIS